MMDRVCSIAMMFRLRVDREQRGIQLLAGARHCSIALMILMATDLSR